VEEVFHFGSRWRHLPKGLVENCFSAIISEVSNFFQFVFCISFVLLARKFNGRKVFEKIIVGGLFLIFLFQQPTLILSKTFLPFNLRADSTKLMQKTD
jgi:uncharacterized membrane protein YagU involved in acid resistance